MCKLSTAQVMAANELIRSDMPAALFFFCWVHHFADDFSRSSSQQTLLELNFRLLLVRTFICLGYQA